MVEEILISEQLIDSKGTYILDKHYQYLLTKDEAKSFKENLSHNVAKITEELKNVEKDSTKRQNFKKKLIKDLESQKMQYQDALKNFKKYIADTIKEFKKNAQSKRKELFEFCQNFEAIKEHTLQMSERDLDEKEAKFKSQLDREQRLLKIYEKV